MGKGGGINKKPNKFSFTSIKLVERGSLKGELELVLNESTSILDGPLEEKNLVRNNESV